MTDTGIWQEQLEQFQTIASAMTVRGYILESEVSALVSGYAPDLGEDTVRDTLRSMLEAQQSVEGEAFISEAEAAILVADLPAPPPWDIAQFRAAMRARSARRTGRSPRDLATDFATLDEALSSLGGKGYLLESEMQSLLKTYGSEVEAHEIEHLASMQMAEVAARTEDVPDRFVTAAEWQADNGDLLMALKEWQQGPAPAAPPPAHGQAVLVPVPTEPEKERSRAFFLTVAGVVFLVLVGLVVTHVNQGVGQGSAQPPPSATGTTTTASPSEPRGALRSGDTTTIRWPADPAANFYQLTITGSVTGPVVTNYTISTWRTHTYRFSLQGEQEYIWTLREVKSGQEQAATTHHFHVYRPLIPAPMLQRHLPSHYPYPGYVRLCWKPVEGALGYTVKIDVQVTPDWQKTCTQKHYMSPGRHTWWVKALKKGVRKYAGPASTWSFSIRAIPPTPTPLPMPTPTLVYVAPSPVPTVPPPPLGPAPGVSPPSVSPSTNSSTGPGSSHSTSPLPPSKPSSPPPSLGNGTSTSPGSPNKPGS